MICSMSRPGNVWNDAAMESFFSSLKTERTARKTCCSPSFTTVVNRGTDAAVSSQRSLGQVNLI